VQLPGPAAWGWRWNASFLASIINADERTAPKFRYATKVLASIQRKTVYFRAGLRSNRLHHSSSSEILAVTSRGGGLMRLTHIQVTNFKSVEDSEEFSVGDVTCLVGKNEAGKTAILQSLYRLSPNDNVKKYDLQSSYPRRFLSEYKDRHTKEEARVLRTRWQLSDTEVAGLKELLGAKAITGTEITVTKSYNSDSSNWTVPVHEGEASKHIIKSSTLHDEERQQLGSVTTIKDLKKHLESLGQAASERHRALLQHLNTNFKRGEASLACIDYLQLPTFLYFSNYDRMEGQVALEELSRKKANNSLDSSDRVFLAFLELVGTSLEEVAQINQFEPLIAKLESVSTRISREIFAYWSQNRHLKVQFRLDAGKPGDPAPFNTGNVLRTRVLNLHHDVSVSFDDRSTGFVWFFSFLVLFSQLKKIHGNNLILLLDEPGLSLHAKAQGDLLRYINEKLRPFHQVIYTTHSPFMVPSDNLLSVRTVEDVVKIGPTGEPTEVLGTKVRDDVLGTDRDTLFPLQGALGYEITQTLFVGPNSLLVEGPSDYLYLTAFSNELRNRKRTSLDQRWVICPVGGVDKVSAFMSLFQGNKLNVAVLTDLAKGQKRKIEDLRKSRILKDGHVLSAEAYTGTDEADIEDLIGNEGYIDLVNRCYQLKGGNEIKLTASDGRILKVVEDHFRTLPPEVAEFDHFRPAAFLVENPGLMRSLKGIDEALDRFEKLLIDLNALI
jgi:predicted ATP-dependent endonuclease of OLD family